MRKTISRRAAPAPTATSSRSIVTSHARKLEAMHELAYELGFFCAPATTFMVDLASKIAVHLKNRSGKPTTKGKAHGKPTTKSSDTQTKGGKGGNQGGSKKRPPVT